MSLPTPAKPSNAGAYKLTGGEFEVTLPTTINSGDEAIESSNYFEEIDGRDGLFPTRSPNFGGRSLNLSGIIQDEETVTQLRRVLDAKRVTVEREERVLECDLVGVSIVEEVFGSIWRVNIDFESAAFYWRSKNLVVETETPAVLFNEGTLRAYPIFTVSAPAEGIFEAAFTINGRTAKFEVAPENAIPSGRTLVINCENLTASTEDGSVTGSMNDTFFTDPPYLTPGSNAIASEIDDNLFTPVLIEWEDGEPVYFNGQPVYWYPFESVFEVKYYERYL